MPFYCSFLFSACIVSGWRFLPFFLHCAEFSCLCAAFISSLGQHTVAAECLMTGRGYVLITLILFLPFNCLFKIWLSGSTCGSDIQYAIVQVYSLTLSIYACHMVDGCSSLATIVYCICFPY